MDIGRGMVNTQIVRGIPNQNGSHAGGACSLHVERGVTQIPDRRTGCGTELL
jgi:hypothetical protein